MATPNIVPRADSEGGLGTSSKYWASAYIDTTNTTTLVATTVNGIPFYTDAANNSMYTHDVSGTDDSATSNTAYGFGSLASITTGDNNVAVGRNAGTNLTSGGYNALFGSFAGDALTTEGS